MAAVIVGEERYVFDCEWYDQQAELIRYYRITFYPTDQNIEMVSQLLRVKIIINTEMKRYSSEACDHYYCQIYFRWRTGSRWNLPSHAHFSPMAQKVSWLNVALRPLQLSWFQLISSKIYRKRLNRKILTWNFNF